MNLAHRLAKRLALHYTVGEIFFVKTREFKLILKDSAFNMNLFFSHSKNFYAEKKK